MTIADHAIAALRRLLDGLLLALVAVSLGVLILGRVLPALGHPTLVVAGPSMGTTIPMGAAVILDQVSASDLAMGDVVSLRSGPDRAIFTHRIIRIADRDGSPWLETQGDANPTPDPSLTPATAVLGRVAVFIPFAGYLVTLYSAPTGILFVISLGLVLLIVGILLEPQGQGTDDEVLAERPPVEPAPPVTVWAAGPATVRPDPIATTGHRHVHSFDRRTAQAVVRASRERRAREGRWVDARRRPEPGA